MPISDMTLLAIGYGAFFGGLGALVLWSWLGARSLRAKLEATKGTSA